MALAKYFNFGFDCDREVIVPKDPIKVKIEEIVKNLASKMKVLEEVKINSVARYVEKDYLSAKAYREIIRILADNGNNLAKEALDEINAI